MAFQQPRQRPQAPRQLSFTKQTIDNQVPASPARKRHLEESQEWILFSPAQKSDHQSQTSQTPRTATQLSDFGSLETHVRSQPIDDSQDAGEATCLGTEIDDDNAELDSLDDGLHAFHHHPFSSSSQQLDQSGGTVLPTHDGLGMFPSSAGLQEQLWQFERHNPHRRRHVRRRSSVQRKLDIMEEEDEFDEADERTARIEKWRLEQSRAVLEEIERETKRRRRRMSRMSGASAEADAQVDVRESAAALRAQRMDSVIAEELGVVKSEEQPEQASESWWQRLTRRVIQDLIGLDETTLSVIFGEQLPDDPSPTPTQPSPIAARASAEESRVVFHDPGYSWETKLLERIARELGVLVHQLSEHEGAFSTYMHTRQEPEYAGMPMPTHPPSLRQRRRRQSDHTPPLEAAPSDALFTPTLPQGPLSPVEATDTSLWGIEEEPSQTLQDRETATRLQQEREYWERDVDVKMIFSYLKRRFSSSSATPPLPPPPAPATDASPSGPLPASWATTTTNNTASALGTSPESLRRAEVIRRQHPLVSRAAERAAAQSRRRDSLLRRHHMQSLTLQKRTVGGSSSCASQSTKRSRQSRSASSRHYWDLGGGQSVGSVGSGGGPAAAGGMGSEVGGWGEV